jgi:NAD(P)-dependent dehydrogenase (short-subunit alcohol dehydrogenase family)
MKLSSTVISHWTAANIPAQADRSVVITGTGGLGYEDAFALASAGGDVIIAGRNAKKGTAAVSKIQSEVPSAKVRFEQVDLANLQSVSDFGARLRQQRNSLDLLINNAAVMNPPERQETDDGFELQFGTNFLGHFALTAELMPLLRQGKNARVVTVSSVAARAGVINFDDLQAKQSYKPMQVYSQSKLACLMFAFELQRRSEEGGWGVASIAAHPGVSRTDLLHNAPGRWSPVGVARSLLWFLFQPAAQGALPTLFAATSPDARGGEYYGPNRMSETRGFPALSKVPPQALDPNNAKRLWMESERLTGKTFDFKNLV